jgi:hypothetical protein
VAIPIVEITDDDFLYRRLAPASHVNPDDTVNSNAFKKDGKPDPEISVDLARLTTLQEAMRRAPNADFRIGILAARDAHDLGLRVTHQPTDENPAHSVIEGNASKATCRLLAEKTQLVAL